MIKFNLYITAAILSFTILDTASDAREFHIDSQQRFDALCRSTFQPGDVIRFKQGVRLKGMFAPRGSGIEGSPIRVTTDGDGDRPRIDAGGKHIAGLMLQDPSYWEVDGLEITNTDGSDADQGELFGIYVIASKREGTHRHIYIDDCYVHDVNGKVAGKKRGGIHVHIKDLKTSIFDDLRITGNRIERIGGVGIGNTSSRGRV